MTRAEIYTKAIEVIDTCVDKKYNLNKLSELLSVRSIPSCNRLMKGSYLLDERDLELIESCLERANKMFEGEFIFVTEGVLPRGYLNVMAKARKSYETLIINQ